MAVDSSGIIYVADSGSQTIRKITPVGTNWIVRTLAGKAGYSGSADGTNGAARFAYPWGLAVDSAGNLYVPEWGNNTVRKVTPVGTNWVVTTLAARADPGGLGSGGATVNGKGGSLRFNNPGSAALDSLGNLYVAECYGPVVRLGYRPYSIGAYGFNGGQFNLEVTGSAGQPVVVDRSPDLQSWTPVGGTNTFTVGPVRVSDSTTSNNSFYWARQQ